MTKHLRAASKESLISLAALLSRFGYLAIFVGTILEGETILIMGGFAAHRGYLELPWVMLIAFLGATVGDFVIYFLARTRGRAWLEKSEKLRRRVKRVEPHVHRHGNIIIIGMRFLYGLRTVLPVAIALCGVPPKRFVSLSIFGAVLWALIGGAAGYLFGEALERAIDSVEKYEVEVLIGLVVAGALVYLIKRYIAGSREKALEVSGNEP